MTDQDQAQADTGKPAEVSAGYAAAAARAEALELDIRIRRLQDQRDALTREINELRGIPPGSATIVRPKYRCQRCNYKWEGRWPGKLPRVCARCHSTSWNVTTTNPKARKPTDPPDPRWQDRERFKRDPVLWAQEKQQKEAEAKREQAGQAVNKEWRVGAGLPSLPPVPPELRDRPRAIRFPGNPSVPPPAEPNEEDLKMRVDRIIPGAPDDLEGYDEDAIEEIMVVDEPVAEAAEEEDSPAAEVSNEEKETTSDNVA